MRNRGFTLIEVVIAGGIFAMLLGTVAVSIHNEGSTHRALVAPITPMMRAQKIMNRLSSELRMASLNGEDRDGDGDHDIGEDTNENGVLDADWSLPDDGCANTLTFNRRIDYKDGTGELITGHFSRRIQYKLDGDRLVREWDLTDDDGKLVTRRSVLAQGVSRLEFCRKKKVVVVTVDIVIPVRHSKAITKTLSTRVWLRN
ncbi:MAG: PulJ/GspJ family protein [Planctomycetota bacterium]|jgi:prepilin-type N-terminal cleavage/methylation domain-containing protein